MYFLKENRPSMLIYVGGISPRLQFFMERSALRYKFWQIVNGTSSRILLTIKCPRY